MSPSSRCHPRAGPGSRPATSPPCPRRRGTASKTSRRPPLGPRRAHGSAGDGLVRRAKPRRRGPAATPPSGKMSRHSRQRPARGADPVLVPATVQCMRYTRGGRIPGDAGRRGLSLPQVCPASGRPNQAGQLRAAWKNLHGKEDYSRRICPVLPGVTTATSGVPVARKHG